MLTNIKSYACCDWEKITKKSIINVTLKNLAALELIIFVVKLSWKTHDALN